MSYKKSNANGQATMANSEPVVIASDQSAVPVSGTITANIGTVATLATAAKQDTGNTSLSSIDTKTPALGQALAASSVPVILPSATITTLTPPAAITNFANETGGNLAAIKAKTDNIPAQGQALAAASLPVVLTAAQITTLTPPTTVTANMGTVTADPFGANADAASASGSISAKLRGIATALGITALDLGSGTGGTRTLRTFQDTAQFVGGTGTDTSATQRVSLATNVALPAGTNAIGKLAANSGVDIGDVDVTSIAAGTNNIGQVSVAPQTANGLSVFNGTSSDGATALTSTAQVIKASAGQVYGWYIYNPNATAQFVQFYNTAAASVTVGTTNPLFMLTIPATSAANVEFTNGITFSNAGFSCAATSTAGGSGAPGTALDAVIFYK